MSENQDKLSTILMIVSFIIPLVGAILYFVKKGEEPKAAQQACYAALAGVAFGIVLNVIMVMVGGGM